MSKELRRDKWKKVWVINILFKLCFPSNFVFLMCCPRITCVKIIRLNDKWNCLICVLQNTHICSTKNSLTIRAYYLSRINTRTLLQLPSILMDQSATDAVWNVVLPGFTLLCIFDGINRMYWKYFGPIRLTGECLVPEFIDAIPKGNIKSWFTRRH